MALSPELMEGLSQLVEGCNAATRDIVTQVPTLEFARRYIQQWGIFTRQSRQCWAHVVGNCPHVDVRRAIVRENLYEEEALEDEAQSHYEILVRLGNALGLSRSEIDQATALPSTVTATLAWETLTKNRSWMEGLAAKGVLERHGFPDLRRIRLQQWQEHLGLSDYDLEFFAMHITADERHGDIAGELLSAHMEPSDLPRILRAAEQSLSAYYIFYAGIDGRI